MNPKTILLAFVVIIAGLTLAIAPSLTVQQALASHPGSDPKADEKASKFNLKALEKAEDGKLDQSIKAAEKRDKICGDGGALLNADGTVHCLG